MTEVDTANRTAEERARVEIDRLLAGAGWAVQDAKRANLSAKRGVALREVVLTPPHGRVDYLLFVDGEACGVVEAKPEGTTLIGVEWQSGRYADGLPQEIPAALDGGLPPVSCAPEARDRGPASPGVSGEGGASHDGDRRQHPE